MRAVRDAAGQVVCAGAITSCVAGIAGVWWALIAGGVLGIVLLADWRTR